MTSTQLVMVAKLLAHFGPGQIMASLFQVSIQCSLHVKCEYDQLIANSRFGHIGNPVQKVVSCELTMLCSAFLYFFFPCLLLCEGV